MKVVFFILILVILERVTCKPRIVGGGKEMKIQRGQNISIECWGRKNLNWYKLINNTNDVSVVNEESHISRIDLEIPLEDVNEVDTGIYVCCYENFNLFQTKQRILKNKKKHFSIIKINVVVVKPIIENGDQIVVDAGHNVNVTCRGERPVTWIFLTNITSGVQHIDEGKINEHVSTLELKNVNYTDVGYFLCAFVNNSKMFYYEDFDHENDINTASTYLFVRDKDHLLTMKGIHHISAEISTDLIIPCKPTFPEVHVELVRMNSASVKNKYFYYTYNKKKGGIIIDHSSSNETIFCRAMHRDRREQVDFIVQYYNPILPNTNISVEGAWQINSFSKKEFPTYDVVEGDVLIIKCSTYYRNSLEKIKLNLPNNEQKIDMRPVQGLTNGGKIQQTRFITDVYKKDSGIYSCYVTNDHVNSTASEFGLNIFSSKSLHLQVDAINANKSLGKQILSDHIMWIIFFRSYPGISLTWYFNGEKKVNFMIKKEKIDHSKPMTKREGKYEIKVRWMEGIIALIIHSPSIKDVGLYSLLVENMLDETLKQNVPMTFIIERPPTEAKLILEPSTNLKQDGEEIILGCSAYGYPLAELSLSFVPCQSYRKCNEKLTADIKNISMNEEYIVKSTDLEAVNGRMESVWRGVAMEQGMYLCSAKNVYGSINSSFALLTITDSELEGPEYLQIEIIVDTELTPSTTKLNLIEGDFVTLICRGNKLFTSAPLAWSVVEKDGIKWELLGSKNYVLFHGRNISILEKQSKYSYISELKMEIFIEMNGLTITCSESSNKVQKQTVSVHVTKAVAPIWTSNPLGQIHHTANENERISFLCSAYGVPTPVVNWFKDDNLIIRDDSDKRISLKNGNITFSYVFAEDSGQYSCEISNRIGSLRDSLTLEVLDPDAAPSVFLFITLAVVTPALILVIVVLIVRIYNENRRNRALQLLKQKVFDDGNPESINPDLDLGEQADLLPYDATFEFPKEKILFDKIIGSGAFGNVFKATALDIVPGEPKTTVAVKMIKSNSDESQLKALRSELKIMIHIGKHINIVNLLGASSKNIVSKGELLLVVEYCRHGNILEYMRRHKIEFISHNNRCETNVPNCRAICQPDSRISFKCLHPDLNVRPSSLYVEQDSRNENVANNSSHEDSIVNTDMSVTDTDNYINYALSEKRPLHLCPKVLLHWAYQIANGMLYLSERKIIHGDLAARNILLADKNIVKISDFGLSKNMYKQENYQKKSKGLLPIKWVALEALRDNIFSTQSDVWSFGIVLWEIFSLGQNPYAAIELDEHFIQKLEQGYRLKKPQYATQELFEIMEVCWHEDPNNRPLFGQLEKKLGNMLGETEKEVYLKLNAQYEETNVYSEHLKLLRTPTYDSRVQEFFAPDHLGYEIPITTIRSGVFLEENQTRPSDLNHMSNNIFQPIPIRRIKSNVTFNDNPKVCVKSCNENYMVMTSPTNLIYQNQHFEHHIPFEERERRRSVFYCNLGNELPTNYTYVGRDIVCPNSMNVKQKLERHNNDSEENDSVFSSSPEEEEEEQKRLITFLSKNHQENILQPNHVETLFPQTRIYSPQKHLETYIPQNHIEIIKSNDGQSTFKRCPVNILQHSSAQAFCEQKIEQNHNVFRPKNVQNNPVYLKMSRKIHEKSACNIYKVSQSNENIYNPCKRNQSDSSSGFGSLVDEKSNSLEAMTEFRNQEIQQ